MRGAAFARPIPRALSLSGACSVACGWLYADGFVLLRLPLKGRWMRKINGLTTLRALAAVWVAVLHFRMGEFADQTAMPFMVKAGYHGVTVFFVLSGFILGYTYKALWLAEGPIAPKAKRYWVARFARIYPTHLFMLIAYAAVLVPLGIWPTLFYDGAKSFLMNVFLIQSWGFLPVVTWNQPAWTVSVELICYIALPALIWIFAPIRGGVAYLAFGVTAASSALIFLIFQTEPPTFVFGILDARMCGWFVLGYTLFLAYEAAGSALSAVPTALLILVGLVMIVASAWFGYRWDGIPAVGTCAIIFALAAGSGPARSIFELAPMIYLGEVSYSFFLSHEATWALIKKFAPAFGSTVETAPLAIELLACLCVAIAVYHGVEAPARRWIRGLDLQSSNSKRLRPMRDYAA
jgi:peptidoglycan/LPS O-acetylase OafA/YrhL